MRRLAAVLALVVLASACGGGAGTTAPETTGGLESAVTTTAEDPVAQEAAMTTAGANSATTTMPAPTSTGDPTVSTTTTMPDDTTSSTTATGPADEDASPASTAASVSDATDEIPPDQPFNPFRSSDPDLRQCLISVFGHGLHDELRDRRPSPAEDAAMEPCMAAFMSSASTTSGASVPDDSEPDGSVSSGGQNNPVTSIDLATSTYPPLVTGQLLLGYIPAPPGFDDCIIGQIGGDRLGEIRSKQPPTGGENDMAAQCLFQLQVPISLLDGQGEQTGGDPGDDGGPVGPADPNSGQDDGGDQVDELTESIITVSYPSTTYSVASGGTSGFFTTAQNADIALSTFGFNNTGGPLSFNYPSGLSSGGTRLVMADTWNNRVLIWNTAPTSARAPDLVLGQPNFTANDAGRGRGQMNWPVSTSTDGTRLVVTDTMNDRILIWNSFPTTNGQPADLILDGDGNEPSKSKIEWPWGVWTDGRRLAVSNTTIGSVLIWNNFPTADDQPADVLLTGSGAMGTPRQITSDGTTLIVGDHNAMASGTSQNQLANSGPGTFFWSTFPSVDDQPYDFFLTDPVGEEVYGSWLRGAFAEDGRLFTLDKTLRIWDSVPQSATTTADLSMLGQGDVGGFDFRGGDFSSVVVVGGRTYITSAGAMLVYDSLPSSPGQLPDFTIGAADIYSDGQRENYIIGNPVPASNGTNLFVSSDLDKRLYVWKNLPDESGAVPDIVYDFCSYRNEERRRRHECLDGWQPRANALRGDTFAMAGMDRLVIWTELPLAGNLPNLEFHGSIGSVPLLNLAGVAIDDRHFYLADGDAGAVYVWEGIPDGTTEPTATLSVFGPEGISSDGTYLTVSTPAARPRRSEVFLVDEIAALGSSASDIAGDANLPVGALAAAGHLFAADVNNSQVLIWEDIADALAGLSADAILGASGASETRPEISRSQLFWPAVASFDGSYLWVGEVKFSGRLVRFSPTG